MISNNEYNFLALLKSGLEPEVKKVVTNIIVEEEVKKFESNLRNKIKELVDKVTFESIDRVKDMYTIRDELRIYVKWLDKEDN